MSSVITTNMGLGEWGLEGGGGVARAGVSERQRVNSRTLPHVTSLAAVGCCC